MHLYTKVRRFSLSACRLPWQVTVNLIDQPLCVINFNVSVPKSHRAFTLPVLPATNSARARFHGFGKKHNYLSVHIWTTMRNSLIQTDFTKRLSEFDVHAVCVQSTRLLKQLDSFTLTTFSFFSCTCTQFHVIYTVQRSRLSFILCLNGNTQWCQINPQTSSIAEFRLSSTVASNRD